MELKFGKQYFSMSLSMQGQTTSFKPNNKGFYYSLIYDCISALEVHQQH